LATKQKYIYIYIQYDSYKGFGFGSKRRAKVARFPGKKVPQYSFRQLLLLSKCEQLPENISGFLFSFFLFPFLTWSQIWLIRLVDDPHWVWGFFFLLFCDEIFSLGHTKKGLWAMICTKGFFREKERPKVVIFLVVTLVTAFQANQQTYLCWYHG
jgi:hypothetical protein